MFTFLSFLAPDAPYTHWKQTVFYLGENDLTIKKGEAVDGVLSMTPNKANNVSQDSVYKCELCEEMSGIQI